MASTFDFKKDNPAEFKKLSGLISKIELLCRENLIPYFMTFNVGATDGEPEYKNAILTPGLLGLELSSEERVRKHALLQSGTYNIVLDVGVPVFEDSD